MDPQILNGLVEVDGGIFANQPVLSLGGIYYDVAVVLWMLGGVNAFQIPGADEYNGVVVNDNYTAPSTRCAPRPLTIRWSATTATSPTSPTAAKPR
ncbi:hypothetical protein EHH44_16875 [Mycolicibacter terrae]|uniref:Uncharacterized protein n=2 Tax=Mycolicibacter terrae TaxID=1788 RepID=A0ACD2EJS7_9MYCO|nr:hypothetical protein EHH44_16875 [Mycolicibacter terrae]